MSLPSPSDLRASLVLRCWEDESFAGDFRRDARTTVASFLSAEAIEALEPEEFESLCSMRVPASPLELGTGLGEETLLLAFWEGVFEPLESNSMIEAEAHPFAELLRPLVNDAGADVEAFAERHPWLARAIPGLQEQLLGRLCSIAGVPLYLWFRVHDESEGRNSVEALRAMKCGDPFRSWAGFSDEYAELTRLLAVNLAQWRDSTLEFLDRMAADRARLAEFVSMPDLEVEAVDAGWSDTHGGGRSVIRVTFCGGQQIAYKPRSLEAEAVWAQLAKEIASHDLGLRIPYAPVLSRPAYGWMAWLSAAACSEGVGYHAAAGRLQCLLQALGAADAHMANCVATAEGPALIDCECLVTPRTRSVVPGDETSMLLARIRQTAFLPDVQRRTGEPDLSGLFGRGGQATGYRIPVWPDSSSEEVGLKFRPAVLRAQANLVPPGSHSISRMAACPAFLEGFSAMHRYLASHNAEVLTALAPLRRHPTRVLLRSTRRYTRILSRSIHPRFLRDREERRRAIASLLQEEPLAVASEAPGGIVEAEIEALERLDVPFFHADGRNLVADGRVLEIDFFVSTGCREAQTGLRKLADEELAHTLSALRLLWIMSL